MKIGIIVYSKTGNTLSVGERLTAELKGHEVELTSLKPTTEIKPDTKVVEFETLPDLGQYDVLILGAPVHAFSLCLPMKCYLDKVNALEGKKVLSFVTQHFKKAWMGGNRALKQMNNIAQSKGAIINKSAVIGWSRADREEIINNTINDFLSELN